MLAKHSHLIFMGLILISLSSYSFYKKKKQNKIRRWQKLLNLEVHETNFYQLYEETNGFALSKKARTRKDGLEYIYGEIEFLSFIALLSLVDIDKNTIFYDLGSGIGKAVFACAMVYPIKKCVGVEILPELHECACDLLKQLTLNSDYFFISQKIEFIYSDFFKVQLEEATLIFINSTTLFGMVWSELCNRLKRLNKLQTIITTSKPLLAPHSFLIKETLVKMSWGVVKAYIHTRKRNLD